MQTCTGNGRNGAVTVTHPYSVDMLYSICDGVQKYDVETIWELCRKPYLATVCVCDVMIAALI